MTSRVGCRAVRPQKVSEQISDGVLDLGVEGEEFVLEHAREVVRIVFEGPESLPRAVVFDLSGVKYINSSGISVLIRLNVERQLVVVGLEDAARDILELAGVLTFIAAVPDHESARARLRGE